MADPWAVQSVEPASDDPWAVVSAEPVQAKPKAKRNAYGEVAGFMANVNRGLGVGDELAAGFATAPEAAKQIGNVLTGKTPLKKGVSILTDAFKSNMAEQRQLEDEYAADRPLAAANAKGWGMAGTALVPGGQATRGLEAGSRGINVLRGATGAMASAEAYGLADRGSAQERLKAGNAAAWNPLTIGLGGLGGALAPVRKPVPKAKAVDPSVKLLADEGVTMTPGQMRGGVAKTAEDAGTSLPFVGDAISSRQTEGLHSFNRAMVNRALKPIGEKLPDDIAAGTEAVKHAGDVLSKGYENAVPGKIVRADPGFADDVQQAFQGVSTMTPDNAKRLADILDERVTSRLPASGAMNGRLYKQIQSDLDFEVRRFSKATDPDLRAMGDAIEGVQAALENAAKRQDPQFAARIKALDRGWAELGRIEAAAAKSTDLSGIATPKQYAGAIRMADGRVRRRGVARGEALSQDLAKAGVRVLPSKMPDSGTAGRSMWGMVAATPGAVIGALTGGPGGSALGIAGTASTLAAASRVYTPQAVEAANKALNSKIASQAQREALAELSRLAASNPEVRKLNQAVLNRLSHPVGVGAGAAQGRRSAVEVSVEGRPDLGVGRSSENLLAQP